MSTATPPFSLRMPEATRAYLSARAATRDRSLNSELNAILRIMMQAEPIILCMTHRHGFHLIGDDTDHARFGAFTSRDEALAEARRLIASMPPGAADLIDEGAV